MFNSKFSTLLTALLIVSIIAIIAIIGYFGYSIYNKYYINASAQDIVDNFEQSAGNKRPVQNTIINEQPDNSNITLGDGTFTNSIYDNNSSSGASNVTYNGYNVIGTISIPKIDIKYPILDRVTTKSLKIAVVYLIGPGINEVGNTVIQGHNYKNGLFFSNLYKLSNGDKIYIKDPSGKQITYEVYKNFEANATDTSFYNRDTAGKREITLSTCTDNTATRTIILAREI